MRKQLSKYLIICLTAFVLSACITNKIDYKADTYKAKTLTSTLREYVELPICTETLLTACHTKAVAKIAATAAEQWQVSNAEYRKAVEAKSGIEVAKAANDVSLAALQAVANSEIVQKALRK